MLALVERFPDLGQDLAKYVLEREQTKEPDTSIADNADWLVRRRHLRCQLCDFISAADTLSCPVDISSQTEMP